MSLCIKCICMYVYTIQINEISMLLICNKEPEKYFKINNSYRLCRSQKKEATLKQVK